LAERYAGAYGIETKTDPGDFSSVGDDARRRVGADWAATLTDEREGAVTGLL
jgi:hypothetical protein